VRARVRVRVRVSGFLHLGWLAARRESHRSLEL
jgi:hypothetical protein